MKNKILNLFAPAILATAQLGCSTGGTPDDVGARPVLAPHAFPPEHQAAIRACADELKSDGENPAEFYAEVDASTRSDKLVIHLWHQSAFSRENRDVVGNPGGKCRDFHFDPKQKRVTHKLFWQ